MLERKDIELSPKELKSICEDYSMAIIDEFKEDNLAKALTNAATNKAINELLRFMVGEGTLSQVNDKHGVHITDEQYVALKKLAEEE